MVRAILPPKCANAPGLDLAQVQFSRCIEKSMNRNDEGVCLMGGTEIWTPVIEERSASEDRDLVAEVQNGSRAAFSALVRKHQRSLLRLSVKFTKDLATAEDVVQEAFMKAFERIKTFEGRSSFRSWLFQIAVNTAKNKLRSRRDGHVDVENVFLSVNAIAETKLEKEAVAKLIQKHIDDLPFRQRTALVLRVYEDLSFKEIADIMECPYDTAKANYRHALLKLRDEVQREAILKHWNPDDVAVVEFRKRNMEADA